MLASSWSLSAQDDAATASPEPPLSAETVETWSRFIQPSAQESRWQAIPWRESFWQAVVDAQRERKPVLLWTMNGHPMGCT
jgi:hypothetical protein